MSTVAALHGEKYNCQNNKSYFALISVSCVKFRMISWKKGQHIFWRDGESFSYFTSFSSMQT